MAPWQRPEAAGRPGRPPAGHREFVGRERAVGQAEALRTYGYFAWRNRENDELDNAYRRAAEISKGAADPLGESKALRNISFLEILRGNHHGALAARREAYAAAIRTGDESERSDVARTLAELLLDTSGPEHPRATGRDEAG